MSYLSVRICLLFLSITLLSACSMSAKILSPQANEELRGAAEFVVKLDSNADASTLNITLDGTDITQSFNPQPFQAGTTLTAIPPVLNPLEGDNQHYIHANAQWAGASSGPQGMGIDFLATALCVETPAIQGNLQSISICSTSPYLCIINLEEDQQRLIKIVLNEAPAIPFEVMLTPSDTRLVLQNTAAGDSVTVTIPTNDDSTRFWLKGIEETSSIDFPELTFTAAGSEPFICRVNVL